MVELSKMLPVVTLAEPRSPSIGFREQICGATQFYVRQMFRDGI